MMNILTAAEMRETDRVTVEDYGVESFALMRAAGAAVARFVLREYAGLDRIVVLCGRGNNGGDGFVAAHYLRHAGRRVTVFLLGRPEDLHGDARQAYELWHGWRGRVELLDEPMALDGKAFQEAMTQAELCVDAVMGTGARPPLRGMAAALREILNQLDFPVVAVDLPSGWDADSREQSAPGAFRANAVVTFTAPKLAHAFGNMTGSAGGPMVVASIGSPEEAVRSEQRLRWTGAAKRIFEVARPADSHKGMYGHVLVVGGGVGKSGAPAMASLAALRAGAGLVTAAVPEGVLGLVAGVAPELMTIPLAQGGKGEIAAGNLSAEKIAELLARTTVLAMGPGLGQEPETEQFVLGLLDRVAERREIAVVLDADALNIVARHKDKLRGGGRTMVLTPHPGEMARLAGVTTKQVQAEREVHALRFAQEHQVTLVLKGWRTLVAHPDGTMAVNTTGTPGMAKGGSGDILTGIVAACLAQHPRPAWEAVEAAVYVHGLAAQLAMRDQDEHTLLATDTVAHLARAFRFRAEDEGGYTWLEGLPHRHE
ncbi:MAG: NAD(P)H-hydrate dehydratase [Acidobacteriaceae bacterium]